MDFGVHRLRAAQRDAEAGHHLVEDQQRTVLRAQLAQALHERDAGAHEIHVAGDRFDHHRRQLVAMFREAGLQRLDVVIGQHQRVLGDLGRHAGAGWVAEGGKPRARLDQQRVGMAVVAALELQEQRAAGVAACQPDAAHAGLGAGADQAQLLDAGQLGHHGLSQLDLALGWGAKGEAVEQRLLYRFDDGRVAVAEDHRPPGADVVDVLLAVGVPEVGPSARRMKRGVPPTARKARTGEFTPPGMATGRARKVLGSCPSQAINACA